VVKGQVCKTSIQRFESVRRLHSKAQKSCLLQGGTRLRPIDTGRTWRHGYCRASEAIPQLQEKKRVHEPPIALDSRNPDAKGRLRATASPPVYGLQAGQGGQDSCLQDRLRLAIPNGLDDALDG
jgi:hypothetical protein